MPVTISGFIIGMLVAVIIAFLYNFDFELKSPMLASTPKTVETKAVHIASKTVFFKACIATVSLNIS